MNIGNINYFTKFNLSELDLNMYFEFLFDIPTKKLAVKDIIKTVKSLINKTI